MTNDLTITGVVTPSRASIMLGVSRATLRRWAIKGTISKCNIGGRLFYLERELENIRENIGVKWN